LKPPPKRHRIADGVKAVYHVHQAFEAVQSLSESKVRKFFEELANVAMMLAAIAFVCGLFWLANLAIHVFKNSFL
jgi:hypothetical protein